MMPILSSILDKVGTIKNVKSFPALLSIICHSRSASVIPAKAGIQYGVDSNGNPEFINRRINLSKRDYFLQSI